MIDKKVKSKRLKPNTSKIIIENDAKVSDDVMAEKTGDNVKFPIVGIGASAGGLAAFEAFFTGMPKNHDPEMAFVLVQHLAPDHKSLLTEIIKRYTRMNVFEVEDGMIVKPNCTYIIPPNKTMSFRNGALQLFEITAPRGQNMPIDLLFRSLAADQGDKAICIILSGTGSDGTLGLRAIKGEGGMAIVQSPDTTEYDGMPMSAIATGLVDYQLPPLAMAKQLILYKKYAYSKSRNLDNHLVEKEDNSLKKVFTILRTQTGHDFSKYKLSTINRRIERRLAVHQIENMEGYVKYLQQTPTEVKALYKDFLIGVTAFFRDKDAFKKLEDDIIPKLFEGKPAGANIRVWCTGCSTGEEAYSIAILLSERMEKLKKNFNIKIFATDIDNQSIAIARAGVYPSSIAIDITLERIARFFTVVPGVSAYHINKTIRDMLIFSEQSIIKDPPFSKLDLISCRNLLIYLNSELQKRVIPLFHYALNPGGILFLGSSESIGDFDTLFSAIDRKLKVYQRKEVHNGIQKVPLNQILPSVNETMGVSEISKKRTTVALSHSLKEITEQYVLKESNIAGIIINDIGDILYLHGRTGMYLEPSQGEAGTNNIIKMAREGLRQELTIALHNLNIKKETMRIPDINVKTNGHYSKINLTIKQITTSLVSSNENYLYIVLLEETKSQKPNTKLMPKKYETQAAMNEYMEELKAELRIKEEYLQTANEELETSNEELKSTNEEMQSTNEEIETSKEELQSINEELSTVNSELQVKVHDLTQANNDMNNLLSGTNIATVFLDYHQNILRFTPTANKIINLISSDAGRPIAHIASNLIDYNTLSNDVKDVLESLIPKEREVQTFEGKWYNMIIQPYRTVENVIEGTVMTFVDITEAKLAKDLLAISEVSYRTLFETTKEGIIILDGITGRIKNVNPFLIELLGFSKKEFLEKEIWDIGFLKDIIKNKDNFLELQKNKYIRYGNLPLETAKGLKVEVEFISNAYEIGKTKIIQCNIRVVDYRV